MTVATIAPTEELEDEAALLDGLTDPDVDTDSDTDTDSDLDSDAVIVTDIDVTDIDVTDIDVDIVTDVDTDTLLDADVTVANVDGTAPEAVTAVATIK